MKFKKVEYKDLNAKQKEIYNFQKVSAVLADYGFTTIKLADDWNGADFLALHHKEDKTLKIQLKGRATVAKKYLGKDLYICFEDKSSGTWYLYLHDEFVKSVEPKISGTSSWDEKGAYDWPGLSKDLTEILKDNKIND